MSEKQSPAGEVANTFHCFVCGRLRSAREGEASGGPLQTRVDYLWCVCGDDAPGLIIRFACDTDEQYHRLIEIERALEEVGVTIEHGDGPANEFHRSREWLLDYCLTGRHYVKDETEDEDEIRWKPVEARNGGSEAQ